MATKTKVNDWKGLDDAALATRVSAEREQLQKATFAHAVTAIENPLSLRTKRRNVARLLTEQSARKNKA